MHLTYHDPDIESLERDRPAACPCCGRDLEPIRPAIPEAVPDVDELEKLVPIPPAVWEAVVEMPDYSDGPGLSDWHLQCLIRVSLYVDRLYRDAI
jgi:hypothetical protein